MLSREGHGISHRGCVILCSRCSWWPVAWLNLLEVLVEVPSQSWPLPTGGACFIPNMQSPIKCRIYETWITPAPPPSDIHPCKGRWVSASALETEDCEPRSRHVMLSQQTQWEEVWSCTLLRLGSEKVESKKENMSPSCQNKPWWKSGATTLSQAFPALASPVCLAPALQWGSYF